MADDRLTFFEILKLIKNKGNKEKKQSKKDKKRAGKATPLPEFISRPPGNDYIEKIFRLPLAEGRCRLNITAMHGNIILSGYERDMVCVKIMYRPKRSDAAIEFRLNKDGKYFLDYNKNDFDAVWAEAHVPSRLFREVKLKAPYGRILSSGISTGTMSVISGGCELKNIFAGNLRLETGKKSAYLQNISAVQGKVALSGGQLQAINVDVKELSLSADHEAVDISAKFDRYTDYKWQLKCRDGKLNLGLPGNSGIGYYILAQARAGGVKLALPNMNILAGGPSFIEARSQTYEESFKKAGLDIEALRAPVVIQ